MLTLPIKKKWFDMILSGEKKEEYREIKPHWEVRIQNAFGAVISIKPTSTLICPYYDILQGEDVPECIRKDAIQPVMFRNGYGRNAKCFVARCSVRVGKGKPEWGAEPGKQYFVLTIHSIAKGV